MAVKAAGLFDLASDPAAVERAIAAAAMKSRNSGRVIVNAIGGLVKA